MTSVGIGYISAITEINCAFNHDFSGIRLFIRFRNYAFCVTDYWERNAVE